MGVAEAPILPRQDPPSPRTQAFSNQLQLAQLNQPDISIVPEK
jgi:hypothetical protein